MRVAVLVKLIPSPDAPTRFAPGSTTLERSGALVLDDADTYSVEVAVRLVENAGEGDVVLVTMAPDHDTSGLRNALAMGADRAILVSDPRLVGSDALATAKVLAAAVRDCNADVVLSATESTDGYTGTLPLQVAQLLDLPSISYATRVALEGKTLRVERQTEEGDEEVECPLPALVSVTAGVVERRYPSFRSIMAAKNKRIDNIGLDDLHVDAATVGAQGARQTIMSVQDVPERRGGELFVGDASDAVARLVEALEVWGALG